MKKVLKIIFVTLSLPFVLVTQIISLISTTIKFIFGWIEYGMDWIFDRFQEYVKDQIKKGE